MAHAAQYAGFNLLVGDGPDLWYASNRSASPRRLAPGLYGLSNHLLDTPWPKLVKAKARLAEALQPPADSVETLLDLMLDPAHAADSELPDTGVPLEWERALSAVFIAAPDYGTRSTTLLIYRADGEGLLVERNFDREARILSQQSYPLNPGNAR